MGAPRVPPLCRETQRFPRADGPREIAETQRIRFKSYKISIAITLLSNDLAPTEFLQPVDRSDATCTQDL